MKTIDKQNFPQGQEIGKTLDVLEHILKAYANPSFGSMSKRDIDVMLFMALQDLGILENATIYDVIQLLHVTRSRARNLIYESSLRRQEDEYLLKELRRLIKNAIFLKDGDKVCIEVDNPFLIDNIRKRLKDSGHITDSSFNVELIKMTPDAFADLYTSLLKDENIKIINDKFIALGVKKDTSAKAVVTNIVKVMARAALGKMGEEVVGIGAEFLGKWIDGIHDMIPNTKNELPGSLYEELNIA